MNDLFHLLLLLPFLSPFRQDKNLLVIFKFFIIGMYLPTDFFAFLYWAVSYVSPNPALRFVMFCHLKIISLCFDMYTVETTGNNFFPLFRQPSISTIVETVSIPQFRQPHVSTRRNCGYIFRNTGKKLSKHWDVETLVCRNNGITPLENLPKRTQIFCSS